MQRFLARLKDLMAALLRSQPLRFLIGGGFTTLTSLIIYWVLLGPLGYAVAYTISYALGYFVSYLVNTYFVFRSRWSLKTLFLFPMVHVVNYICGLGVVWFCVRILGVRQELAPIAAVACTVPLSYVLSRRLIKQ